MLSDLYKLAKLKKLELHECASWNILGHLLFGVFYDLEELDAHFEIAFEEDIQEMSRFTPNLKKLKINFASSDIINAFLGNLESLETVNIYSHLCDFWNLPDKVHPQIKHLDINTTLVPNFTAEQFTKAFPNLEFFKTDKFRIDDDSKIEDIESFFVTLLSGLKKLRGIHMEIWVRKELNIDQESLLRCVTKYGKNLQDVKIHFNFRDLKNPRPGFIIAIVDYH